MTAYGLAVVCSVLAWSEIFPHISQPGLQNRWIQTKNIVKLQYKWNVIWLCQKIKSLVFLHIGRSLSENKKIRSRYEAENGYSPCCFFFFWSLFSCYCHHWDFTELSTLGLSLSLSWENERLHKRTKSFPVWSTFQGKSSAAKLQNT